MVREMRLELERLYFIKIFISYFLAFYIYFIAISAHIRLYYFVGFVRITPK